MHRLLLLAVALALSVAIGYLIARWKVPKKQPALSHQDIQAAKVVVSQFDKTHAYALSDKDFESLKDRILIVGVPHTSEEYTYYDWPNWEWNTVESGGSELPQLLSRFRNYYGAFNTGGLMWSVRPGVHPLLTMPYGKWMTNNGRYYYVSNE